MYTIVLTLDGIELDVPKSRDAHLKARAHNSKSNMHTPGKLFSSMDGMLYNLRLVTFH